MNPLFIPAIASTVVDLGKSLIDRMFPDREKQAAERAAAELQLATLTQDGSLKELATRMSAIVAEANSSDPWTSRARPTFLYVMYIMILTAIPMGVLSAFRPDIAQAIANGMGLWLRAIPGELYALFGVGYTGYTVMRGVQETRKQGNAQKALGIF